ncbi:SAVMC3_10250 family protein [Streptomyces sp. NPDC002130]|uniref:DUF7019 family protein n=1 Tax=Streptomyces sp. NPDC002130 TaxID=3155568 RepID=UPI0033197225
MTSTGGFGLRLFRRKKQPLRHFLYVSDTKLDMLFDQIEPALLRRISAEARIDLRLASVTLHQAEAPQATRMAKLQLIERYIDTYHQVGTSAEPGHDYFRGCMPMQWGWLSHGFYPDSPTGGLDTVFFRGEDNAHLVILAGSRRHVLGEQPAAENTALLAHSATPNIMAVIAEHISGNPALGQRWRSLRLDPNASGSEDAAAAHDPPEIGLREAARVRLGGPAQQLEFLAVPILSGSIQIEPVLDIEKRPFSGPAVLGTPLYVAVARHPDTA